MKLRITATVSKAIDYENDNILARMKFELDVKNNLTEFFSKEDFDISTEEIDPDGIPKPFTVWHGDYIYAGIGFPRSGVDQGEWGAHYFPGQLERLCKEGKLKKPELVMAAKELLNGMEQLPIDPPTSSPTNTEKEDA